MKKLYTLFLFLSLVRVGYTQDYDYLSVFEQGEKVYEIGVDFSGDNRTYAKGLINMAGEEIIPAIYSALYKSEGTNNYYTVEKGGNWGVIDASNKIIIPFNYQSLRYYTNKLIAVYKNGKWGIINSNEKIIVPLNYHYPANINDDYFILEKAGSLYGLVNKKGKPMIPFEYNHIGIGYYSRSGGDNYNVNKVYVSKNGLYGVKTLRGKEVLPTMFANITFWSNDLVVVEKRSANVETDDLENTEDNRTWGLYSAKKKKYLLPATYNGIYFHYNNLVAVMNKQKQWGIINLSTHKMLVPFVYNRVEPFSDKVILGGDENKLAVIDLKTGVQHSSTKYQNNYTKIRIITKHTAMVHNGRYYGLIDDKGNELTDFIYKTDNDSFVHRDSVIIARNKDGNWGFLSTSGKQLSKFDYKYDKPVFCGDNLLLVFRNRKWMTVDYNGKVVTEFDNSYRYITKLTNTLLKVKDFSDKYGVIDLLGNQVIPCLYADIEQAQDGYFIIKKLVK